MTALYRGMDRAALDAAYNNSAAVANSAQLVADWQRRSEALSGRKIELRYGGLERNRIDLFEHRNGAPLLVFIHGGYWQMRSRENFYFIVSGPMAHGCSVALVGYTLAPQKRLDGIVEEVRSALDFLDRDVILSGWSAGAHLTAMAMGHPRVRAGLAISGIYDLEPMRHCYVNEKLGLDEPEARRNSPVLREGPGKPLIVSYGTAELPELQRQSEEYGKAVKAKVEPLAGHDHFTILEELASPAGRLTAMVRELAALAA
jgi:acetyl esterase/lipase